MEHTKKMSVRVIPESSNKTIKTKVSIETFYMMQQKSIKKQNEVH